MAKSKEMSLFHLVHSPSLMARGRGYTFSTYLFLYYLLNFLVSWTGSHHARSGSWMNAYKNEWTDEEKGIPLKE